MKDFVSSRRLRVFSFVATLSLVGIACSILLPHGLPWMGLGWAALALGVGSWLLSRRSDRSIAQILREEDAQPVPAMAKRSLP